jgi:hypothetical protein
MRAHKGCRAIQEEEQEYKKCPSQPSSAAVVLTDANVSSIVSAPIFIRSAKF